MMFDDAIQQAIAVKDKAVTSIVKLGKVTSVSGGRAYVQHYGEGSASNKQYTFIDQYFPEVNDIVAMLPQGNTWIIIGKVCDTAPVQKWATVDHNHDGVYLPVAYKNKIEDSTDILELSSHVLLPNTNNVIGIGNSSKMMAASYFKSLYVDNVQVQPDRIQVTSGGNTYYLVLSYSSSTAVLTPSADGTFALGTSAKKFKEAYLGLFRGSWKSGQSTERQISWNSSNALVPDANNTVDLGSSSYVFGNAYVSRLIGALAYSSSSGNINWNSATVFAPSASDSIELGSSSKQFNAFYTKKLYLNGTEFDPSGITLNKLHTTYGTNDRDLTLSANASGMFLLPNVNNILYIGSGTYKVSGIYFVNWMNGTRSITFNSSSELYPDATNAVSLGTSSKLFKAMYATDFFGAWKYTVNGRSVAWDSSNNIVPDTTNTVSLGTSNKQYKNVYGQNLYVNGTAVTSDRRGKKDIKQLDERYEKFFSLLNPSGFKYIDGESDRTHTGFIAQEVEEAAKEAGLSENDLAVVVIDQDGRYYLRYEELVAVQAQVIQKMQRKVDSLEARIARLEALLERSMDK